MSGLGEYARYEAEVVLARAAAVRDLMATGATHEEARAAVEEHLNRELPNALADEMSQLSRRAQVLIRTLADELGPSVRSFYAAFRNVFGETIDDVDKQETNRAVA